MLRGVLATVLFLMVLGVAQAGPRDGDSSEPTPKAPETASEQQPESRFSGETKLYAEPLGTAQPVSAVPSAHAVPAGPEGQQQSKHGGEEGTEFWRPLPGVQLKITDSLLVLFTFLLFVSTILLWWSTNKVANATVVAADTAKAAADASVATERARLYVEITDENLGALIRYRVSYPNSGSMNVSDKPHVACKFRNYGKTPCVIREVSLGIALAPAASDIVYSVAPSPEGEVVPPGGASSDVGVTADGFTISTLADLYPIVRGEKYSWVYGRVIYADVFDILHIHRFYFRYTRVRKDLFFQPHDYKHYNQST